MQSWATGVTWVRRAAIDKDRHTLAEQFAQYSQGKARTDLGRRKDGLVTGECESGSSTTGSLDSRSDDGYTL